MKFSEGLRKGLAIREKLGRPYCAAVIVAAGSSSRMGGTNKILTVLEKVSRYLKAYDKMRMVVAGGETRTDSVMAGLAAVSDCTQLVAVHDGARPLVTDEVIRRAVSKAKKFAAAAPAVRVKDTIKVSTDGAVEETPDRSKLYAVQTPQVFDRDLLAAALQNAKEQEIAITDDCSAVEALGMPVQLTDGDEENLKITTPLDLELAALILRRRANA